MSYKNIVPQHTDFWEFLDREGPERQEERSVEWGAEVVLKASGGRRREEEEEEMQGA